MAKRGRPRTEPTDVRRRHIISAALAVLSRKGYQDVLLDDVAGRAGIAKGTLYLYFKDKEDMFAAALENILDGIELRIVRSDGKRLSPLNCLKRIMGEELAFADKHRDFLAQFAMEKPTLCSARAGRILQKRFEKHVNFLSQRIRACIRKGLLRKHNPFTGALLLISLLRMFSLRKVILKKRRPLRESADELMELFTKGLGVRRR